ncbi:CARDB domain-containing protein [Terrarubrum flagellatum]|uniref:CARDB domain-containing protein n=1 Tax=Terrirubrum flagellatum TaxID=2895980 RepID=UPI0031454A35
MLSRNRRERFFHKRILDATAEMLFGRSKKSSKNHRRAGESPTMPSARKLLFEALEPRILMSADLNPLGSTALSSQPQMYVASVTQYQQDGSQVDVQVATTAGQYDTHAYTSGLTLLTSDTQTADSDLGPPIVAYDNSHLFGEARPLPGAQIAGQGFYVQGQVDDGQGGTIPTFPQGSIDETQLQLDGGQTLVFSAHPNGAHTKLQLDVLDAGNNVIATAQASDFGQRVTTDLVTIADSGTYTFRITNLEGDSPTYIFADAYLNTVFDPAPNGNGDIDISATETPLVGGGNRTGALGAVFNGDPDRYVFDLNEGQNFTIAATSRNDMSSRYDLTIKLYDPNGQLIGQGVNGALNVDQIIANASAPMSGRYVVEVSTNGYADYALSLLKDVTYEADRGDLLVDPVIFGSSGDLATSFASLPPFSDTQSVTQQSPWLGPGGSAVGGFINGRFLYNVAVVGGSEAQALVDQINGSQALPLSATLVSPQDLATVDALTHYNLVVLSGSYGDRTAADPEGDDAFVHLADMADALKEWVRDYGGGVVTMGNALLGTNGSIGSADLDDVIPVDATHQLHRDVVRAMTGVSAGNPVTAGLGAIDVFGNSSSAPADASAEVAALTDDGRPGVVLGRYGQGRTVFLAPSYGDGGNAGNLRTGDANQLLQQALVWALNSQAWDSFDDYTIYANAGDTISIHGATLNDEAGLPTSNLQVSVEAYDTSKNYLGSGDSGQSSDFSFQADQTGVYVIRVRSGGGGTGAYQVNVTGATGEPPLLASGVIADGSIVGHVDSLYRVDFSAPIDLSSLSASAFLFDGNEASDYVVIDGDTIGFMLPFQPSDGEHQIEIQGGWIRSLDGRYFDGASTSFTLDSTPPQVVASSVAPNAILDEEPLTLQIQLSEDVKSSLIGGHSAGLFNLSTGDFSWPTTVNYDAGSRILTVSFANELSEGNYLFVLYSDVKDFAGNLIDGYPNSSFPTGDGVEDGQWTLNFSVDTTSRDLTPLPAVGPEGGMIHERTLSRSFGTPDDIDDFTVSLEPNARLSVAISPSDGVLARIELVDSNGVTQAIAESGAPGAPAQLFFDGAGGDYIIRVTALGTTGTYQVTAALNATIAAEGGGVSNDAANNAVDLDATQGAIEGVAAPLSAVGDLSSDSDIDFFKLSLAAGQTLDVALTEIDGGAQPLSLSLYDENGVEIARGASNDANSSLFIGRYVATTAGVYSLKVSAAPGSGAARYALTATRDEQLENTLPDLIAPLTSNVLFGRMEAGPLSVGGAIRVAIHGVSTDARAIQARDQLNDSTRFNFQATIVDGGQIDTLAELSQYDVVILGNEGVISQLGGFADALKQFVLAGGGVVATGFTVFGTGYATQTARQTIDDVVPVDAIHSYNYYSSANITFSGTTHPITDDVTSFTAGPVEVPYGGADSDATVLGFASGQAAIVAATKGLGHSVYIGVPFADSTSSALRSGSQDRLFEQAVKWAARAGDSYTVQLAAGQTLTVSTALPGAAAGDPVNTLDPTLEIFDEAGHSVAFNDNASAGEKNALISFTAATAGTYRIVVGAKSGDGDYILNSDVTSVAAPLTVAKTSIADGARLKTPPQSITIDFSDGLLLNSIDAGDLTINGAPANSVTIIDGNTLVFDVSGLAPVEGSYTIAIADGALSGLDGRPLAAFSSSFLYDLTPPQVISITPNSSTAPFTQLVVTFDEPVDGGTVQLNDIALTGPNGSNIGDYAVAVSGATVTYTFYTSFQGGAYQVSIGPDISDIAGNTMAAAYTGSFAIKSPDLVVSNATAEPTGVFGSTYTVTYTVTNIGDAPISSNFNAWQDRIDLSTDPVRGYDNATSTNDIQFVDVPINTYTNGVVLAPGESYTKTITATLPFRNTDAFTGPWYVIVTPNIYYGGPGESRGDNNSFAIGPVQLSLPPTPDLRVADIDAPTDAYFGQTVTVNWNDLNAGDGAPGGNWTDRVFFSTDANLDYFDPTLASVSVNQPALGAGEKAAQTASVTIPYDGSSDPNRTYYLIIATDNNDNVYEHKNNQNNYVAIPIHLQLPPRLDLQVDSTSLSAANATFGNSIDVTYTVTNHGAGDITGTWKDAIFLTNAPDGYGSWLASVDMTNETLAAGASYTRTVTVQLPLSHDYNPGQWYFRVETDIWNGVFEYQAEDNNGGPHAPVAISDPPLPDLRVENLNVPANGVAGSTIHVSYDTVNRGTGAANGDWLERVYLSYGDSVIDYTDRILTQFSNGGAISLAAGASLHREFDLTLPLEPSFLAGGYSVIVAADLPAFINFGASSIYEPNGHETDNTASAPMSVTIPPLPDLTVTALSELPEAISGQRIPITWTITNNGAAPVTGWRDTIALSSDNAVGNDIWLADVDYEGTLAPGQSVTQTVEVTIPDTLSGSYRIVITTDADNRYYEYPNETNNSRLAVNPTAIKLKPFPNLVITSVTIPETGASSEPIDVEWTVQNIGDGATNAPYWFDYVYLSNDGVLDAGDIILGRVDNPSYLDAGESYVSHLTTVLPRGIEGSRYIIIAADRENNVFEFGHENDNLRVSGSIDVSLTPPPNLQVTAVAAPSNAVTGDPMALSFTVTNTGETRTYESQWWDRIYVSTDATFSGDDIQLAQLVHNGALDAGAAYTVNTSVVPPIGHAGNLYFLVMTDVFSQVYEGADESDNTGSDLVNVVHRPPPDLAASIVAAPSVAIEGHTVSVTYHVSNDGSTETPNYSWFDNLYLSTDGVLDASDPRLGDVHVTQALAVGGGYTFTVSGKLPSFIEGDYHLIVAADANDELFEFNNANNIATSALHIDNLPADLTTVVDAPDAGVAGRPIRVNWTVTNNGVGSTSSSSWTDRVILSTDDIAGNGDDFTLAEVDHTGQLAVGASYNASTTFSLPYWALGNYHILVASDVREKVDETSETNNAGANSIAISRQVPDLIVTSVSTPPASNAGDTLDITFTVKNVGNNDTQANFWYDRVYIADQNGLNTFSSPVLSTVRHTNALAPDGSYTVTVTVQLPETLATGDYNIYALADIYNNVIEEPLEFNNASASGVFHVTGQPPKVYDLQVTSVDAADQAVSGQLLTVTYTVANNGSALSGAWYDVVYLSVDQNLQRNGDVYLGAVAQNRTVGAGESYTVTQTFQIPKGYSGPYYVFVVSDSTNAVKPEISEANNVGYDPVSTLISLAQPADLVVGDFSIPENLPLGVEIDLTYSVQNQSSVTAVGSWYDSLYLSSDDAWDIGDRLIGRVLHTGGVGANSSYTETLHGVLPGVIPGDYHVIVRTDIRNLLPETVETNNITGSLNAADIDVPRLTLGDLASGVIPQGGGSYYKLDLEAGQTVRITLDGADAGSGNELYVRFNAMAGRGVYDFSSATPFEEDQSLVIPTTQAGTYYIYVVNTTTSGANPTRAFAIKAESIPFSITGVEQSTVGNSGAATIRIDGALFEDSTIFVLVNQNDEVLYPDRIVRTDASRAYVTFDLFGTPAGTYTVQAVRGDGTVFKLAGGLTVVDGAGANIETVVDGPAFVWSRRTYNVNFYWKNTGDIDTMAPLIRVHANGQFGLNATDMRNGLFLALGSSPEGPTDILAPGAQHSATFAFLAGTTMAFETVSGDSAEPIDDWSEVVAAIRPPSLTDAQWTPFWNRLQPEIGDKWGDLVRFINRVAGEVAAPGEALRDIHDIFARLYAKNPEFRASVTISGVLRDSETGAALSGVEITAYRATPTGYQAGGYGVTAADGSFSIGGLLAGQYILVLPQDGPLVFDLDSDGFADQNPPSVIVGDTYDVTNVQLKAVDEVTQADIEQNTNPIFVTDTLGNAHMFWERNGDLWHADYDGANWINAGIVSQIFGPANLVQGSEFTVVASDKLIDGTRAGLVVVWRSRPDVDDVNDADIYYAVGLISPDGIDWSKPTKVGGTSVNDDAPQAQVLADGRILVSWRSKDLTTQDDADLYYALIPADGGALLFSSDVLESLREAIKNGELEIQLSPSSQEVDPTASISSFNWSTKVTFPLSNRFTKQFFEAKFSLEFAGSVYVDRTKEANIQLGGSFGVEAKQYPPDVYKSLGWPAVTVRVGGEASYQGYWVVVGCDDPQWQFNQSRLNGSVNFGIGVGAPIERWIGLLPTLPGKAVEKTLEVLRRYGLAQIDTSVDFNGGIGGSWRWQKPSAWPVQWRWPDNFTWIGNVSVTGQLKQSFLGGTLEISMFATGKLSGDIMPDPQLEGTVEFGLIVGGEAVTKMVDKIFLSDDDGDGVSEIKLSTTISVLKSSSASSIESQLAKILSGGVSSLAEGEDFTLELVHRDGGALGGNAVRTGAGVFAVESNVGSDLTDDGMMTMARGPDGLVYGVWENRDPVHPGISSFALSVFDGTSWGAPVTLAGTGNALSQPIISFDKNGALVIAWSEATGTLQIAAGAISMEQLDAIFRQSDTADLFYGTYKDGVWSGPTRIAQIAGQDAGLQIVRIGDTLGAVWINSTYGAATSNVMVAFWDGAAWTTPAVVATAAGIDKVTIGAAGGKPTVFWTEEAGTAQLSRRLIASSSFANGVWSAKSLFSPALGAGLSVALDTLPASSQTASDSSDQPIQTEGGVDVRAPSIFGPPEHDENYVCKIEPPKDYKPVLLVSVDPNDIIGPQGAGDEKWVRSDLPLSYTIRFENADFATAPAKTVTIVQQMDSDLDIRTFRVDDFGWSGMTFAQDGDRSYYSGRIDLSATKGYMVDVLIVPDIATNTITWTFIAIDPTTGEPVDDARGGFLPPNDDDGVGEGYVSYTVKAKSGLTSGAVIDAKATIVFDVNEPIETPAIFNTLDVGKPSSAVEALPAQTDDLEFEVSWGGQDDAGGSAIAAYTIYYAIDGGGYSVFKLNTTDTSALFVAEAGRTYSFYSVATDIAGYTEDAPSVADTVIQIGGVPPTEIDGLVFEDMNGDGAFGAGDHGIAGRTVFIDADDDGVLDVGEASVVTDSEGHYAFTGLTPATYHIVTLPPTGWTFTTAGAVARDVDATTGGTVNAAAYGLFKLASITGVVFNDVDADGVRDVGDAGVGGRVVYLDADDDGSLGASEVSTITGSDGFYSFGGLIAGSYVVREVVADHWAESSPAGGSYVVGATSGLIASGRNFGTFELSDVAGVAFEDVDGDGVRDAGEGALAGFTVFLDADGDGVRDAGERFAVTGFDGRYVIADVRPGDYVASLELPQGWVLTAPSGSSSSSSSSALSLSSSALTTSGSTAVLSSPDLGASGLVTSGASDSAWASALTGLSAYRADPRFAGFDGSGTTVAVIDTGIDVNSSFFGPDRNGDGVSDRIVYQYDFADHDGDASDRSGHGSNVSSIIAGSDATYGGVAPGADIVALKVFSDNGAGYFAYVEQALQWVVANAAAYHISVVNLSLGDGADWTTASSRYGLGDEFAALASEGVIVVAAAGNGFYSFGSQPGVSYPASDPNVLAVGAVWSGDYGGPWRFANGATDATTGADRIASFSQRGDQVDVFAPGARLTGANATGGLSTMQGTSGRRPTSPAWRLWRRSWRRAISGVC